MSAAASAQERPPSMAGRSTVYAPHAAIATIHALHAQLQLLARSLFDKVELPGMQPIDQQHVGVLQGSQQSGGHGIQSHREENAMISHAARCVS